MDNHLVPESSLKTFIAESLHPSRSTITLRRSPSIEGDDHMIFFIEEEPKYILRVTKPRDGRGYNGVEMQTRDIALRRTIQSEYKARGLSWKHIPSSVASGLLSQDDVHAASLETRLHGCCLDPACVTSETFDGLVDFLAILKAVDVRSLEKRLGIRVPLIPFTDLHRTRESAIEAWKRLVRLGQVLPGEYGHDDIDSLLENKTTLIDQIQPQAARMTLIHNDIKGEHILVDDESGRITGILDWADAGMGNPVMDIAGLVFTVGIEMAARISQNVGYDSNEVLQGVIQARCDCVLRLDNRLNGLDTDSPVELLKSQLAISLRD